MVALLALGLIVVCNWPLPGIKLLFKTTMPACSPLPLPPPSLSHINRQVVVYYIAQSKSSHHGVREASCACIAELMEKVSGLIPNMGHESSGRILRLHCRADGEGGWDQLRGGINAGLRGEALDVREMSCA